MLHNAEAFSQNPARFGIFPRPVATVDKDNFLLGERMGLLLTDRLARPNADTPPRREVVEQRLVVLPEAD